VPEFESAEIPSSIKCDLSLWPEFFTGKLFQALKDGATDTVVARNDRAEPKYPVGIIHCQVTAITSRILGLQ
jgi:hypothetical protein